MKLALLALFLCASTLLNAQFQIDSMVATDETCAGSSDGTLTIYASGGVTPYSYDVDGLIQSSNVYTALACGSHSIIVVDAAFNTVASTQTINCATPLISTVSTMPPTCNGGCDGLAIITTTSGTPPYTVNHPMGGPSTTYTSTGTLSGLCAGTYTILIQDAAGCTELQIMTVTEPTPVVVTITGTVDESSPGACDGQVSATAGGGVGGPYMSSSDCGLTWFFTAPPFSGLCAGTYGLMTMDA